MPKQSFFVTMSLPPGVDAILGVSWMTETKASVLSHSISLVAEQSAPAEEFFKCESGRFTLQPERNFCDLGFSCDQMTDEDTHKFVVCAALANFEGLDDFVNYEPPNPLLDIDDDVKSLVS